MNYYVYVYFDPSRDMEAFYVGKGKRNRSHCHLKRTDNHPLTNRLKKLSLNEITPIIERFEVSSEVEAFDLEIKLIKEIGRRDLRFGPLLNLTDGGEGTSGLKLSDETKLKLSLIAKNRPAMSDEVKAKMKLARNNRLPISDETRIKLSEAGKKRLGTKYKVKEKAPKVSKKRSPMSDETKKKLSEARIGMKFSQEHKMKISLSGIGNKNAAKVSKVEIL